MFSINKSKFLIIIIELMLFVNVLFAYPKFHNNSSLLTHAQKRALELEIERISVSRTVNPCHNFYEYTCGTAMHYGKYLNRTRQNPNIVLEEFFTSDTGMKNTEVKAKDFYISCNGNRDLAKLQQMDIYQLVGGWPIIDTVKWYTKKFNLAKTLGEFRKVGTNTIIDLSVTILHNQKVLFIQPDRRYYPFYDDHQEAFADIMRLHNIREESLYNAMNEIRDFTSLRHELATDHSLAYQKDISYKNLKETIQFDWDEYFETLLEKPLSDNDRIVIRGEVELRELLDLVKSFDQKVIANYIWIAFLNEVTNTKCHILLERYFPATYKKLTTSPPYNKDDIIRMFNEFEIAHKKVIEGGRWTLPENDKLAKVIVTELRQWTAYASARADDEFINIQIDRDNFYRNIINSGLHITADEFSDLYKLMNVYSVPFLSLGDFLSFMEYTSYNKDLPSSMNYARLGTIFGFYAIKLWHTTKDWETSDEFRLKYNRLRTCLSKDIHFLNNVSYPDKSDDANFLKEGGDQLHWTIILNGAIRLAYESYMKWLPGHEEVAQEEDIISRDHHLNNKMLFFLAHTSLFCTDYKFLANSINAELRNLPQFSETFQCPDNSKMNPKAKCTIW